jgi:hypothetical protein
MALASLTGAVGAARAAPPAKATAADVEAAEQQYSNMNYDDAYKIADRVIRQVRGLSHDQLVRVYRVYALTSAVLDKEDTAREAFVLLLTYNPDFQADPNLGPRVTTPFVEARGFWRAQQLKPGIDVTATLRQGEPAALRVSTRDPTHIVRKVTVGFRWDPNAEFSTRNVAAADAVPVDLPPAPPNQTKLDYYALALDERDNVVFESGNTTSPKSAIAMERPPPAIAGSTTEKPPASSSVFSSPVFWIVTGVVVVGGATAIVLATRKQDEEFLPPTSATFSPRVCGGKCP